MLTNNPTQPQRVVQFLREHRSESFTARDIAEALVAAYPAIYADKAQRSGFTGKKILIQQIVAEIGSQKDRLVQLEPTLTWQDHPRPRRYCVPAEDSTAASAAAADANAWADANAADAAPVTAPELRTAPAEHDLYPLLETYLYNELGLRAMRIREGSSHNSAGRGANRWLHPDLAALEPIGQGWQQHVRDIAQRNGSTSARLWSFEVKRELSMGNVRECFFQAVSNSSWAHEGYLVAAAISNQRTEQELRMLSALHGIGVMLLNCDNLSESEIVLPARRRPDADWRTVDRLATENGDFAVYVERVLVYLTSGSLQAWSRP